MYNTMWDVSFQILIADNICKHCFYYIIVKNKLKGTLKLGFKTFHFRTILNLDQNKAPWSYYLINLVLSVYLSDHIKCYFHFFFENDIVYLSPSSSAHQHQRTFIIIKKSWTFVHSTVMQLGAHPICKQLKMQHTAVLLQFVPGA